MLFANFRHHQEAAGMIGWGRNIPRRFQNGALKLLVTCHLLGHINYWRKCSRILEVAKNSTRASIPSCKITLNFDLQRLHTRICAPRLVSHRNSLLTFTVIQRTESSKNHDFWIVLEPAYHSCQNLFSRPLPGHYTQSCVMFF